MHFLEKKVKVRELIKTLLDYNLDAEVSNKYFETVEVGYTNEAYNHKDELVSFEKHNTPVVWIDGCDYVKEDD